MLLQLLTLLAVLVGLVFAITKLKVHPFVALICSALSLGLLLRFGGKETVDAVLTGFGNTVRWIAIVVILGAFVGEVLRDTGGAFRIARAVVKKKGAKRLPWAMGFTGYIVSIPVFVDVAYIILQPVTEALASRSKRTVLVIGLALTAGLTVSHTLIPPTPGPLAVASQLEADVGRMLLINGFVGVAAMAGGILWVLYFCSGYRLPVDAKLADATDGKESFGEEGGQTGLVWMDLLPILIPFALMAGGTFFSGESESLAAQLTGFFSTPMIAVLVGAGVAAMQFRRLHKKSGLGELVEQAILKSALVIMITGAGGSLGHVIRSSGMQDSLASYLGDVPALGFLLPFLIAAALTTATGSITVSLIGTSSIVGPIAGSLPYSPEIMAALIGAGSFCVFHANSSFFWLLNRLHDAPVGILYRTYTLQSLVMGVSGLMAVVALRLLGVQ
ncbi:GntP family permease [Pelagicoccus mobilis]|uniref:GntP family permease n=1 Tax=Pelagicoccus mobilis TaxID=415221 RepID=A0A934RZ73_9BACT|nr:GntP family permease [Pelagicoccus mobilis]MBK1877576.1 GntP family permease [Pelagicoccus mobilis]